MSLNYSHTWDFARDERSAVDCITEINEDDRLHVETSLHRFELRALFLNPKMDPPVWVVEATSEEGIFVATTHLHLMGSHAHLRMKGEKVNPADIIMNRLVGGMRIVLESLVHRDRPLWLIGPVREITVSGNA